MNFSKVNYGKNSGLKNDTEDFEQNSSKPLKYYTSNFVDKLSSNTGLNFVEGFGKPGGFTDTESQLIRSTITNPRIRQNFGFLPFATTGGLETSGPIISETIARENRSCQDYGERFFDRKFFNLADHKNMVEDERKGSDTRQIGRKSANGRT